MLLLNRVSRHRGQLGDDLHAVIVWQVTPDQFLRVAVAGRRVEIADAGSDGAGKNGRDLGFARAPAQVRDAVVGAELNGAEPDAGKRAHVPLTRSVTASITRSTSSSVSPGWNGSERQPQ